MIEVSNEFYEQFDISPSEKAAFNFFFSQTAKEGLPIVPDFAWAQFHDGVAPFNGKPMDEFDKTASILVPNYTTESSIDNDIYPFTPIDQSISEGFIRNLEKARIEKSARVVGIHPTLASPLIYARAIGLGYEKYLDMDIRPNIYIIYGAYPTTMSYNFGNKFKISPIELGRTLGNVILTAPKSDNTLTEDEMVIEWMTATRSTFKMRNHDVLTEPGNIVIVIPAGRRGEQSKLKINPRCHKEFLPDGSIGYITEYDDVTFVMGVGDSLLVNKDNPTSFVHVGADSIPFEIVSRKTLRDALVRSAMLASTRLDLYAVEGTNDQRIRLGMKAAGKLLNRPKGEVREDIGY